MTDGKTRLAQLAARISEKPKEGKTASREPSLGREANPPHGEKGDFIKVTVTLPPDIYQMIMAEAVRRKMHKERNPQLSAVIREAVVQYLERKE
jgi:hypothetical protein